MEKQDNFEESSETSLEIHLVLELLVVGEEFVDSVCEEIQDRDFDALHLDDERIDEVVH